MCTWPRVLAGVERRKERKERRKRGGEESEEKEEENRGSGGRVENREIKAGEEEKKIMKNSEAGEEGRGNVENRLEWRARSGRWIKESRDTAFGG